MLTVLVFEGPALNIHTVAPVQNCAIQEVIYVFCIALPDGYNRVAV